MGYGRSSSSATTHLRDKIELAVVAQVAPILGTANPNEPLAAAIAANRSPGVEALLVKLQAVDSITVESTDAQLDSAVLSSSSLELLEDVYGVEIP